MIYVENKNTHPDVREQLWLRSAGALQMMESYSGYQIKQDIGVSKHSVDYYEALHNSPTPPNSSVGTIKADQTRIKFDLEVTKEKKMVKTMDLQLRQRPMQDKFANVMITYHKRNGAFIYN